MDLEAAEGESKFGDCSCYSVLFSLGCEGLVRPQDLSAVSQEEKSPYWFGLCADPPEAQGALTAAVLGCGRHSEPMFACLTGWATFQEGRLGCSISICVVDTCALEQILLLECSSRLLRVAPGFDSRL